MKRWLSINHVTSRGINQNISACSAHSIVLYPTLKTVMLSVIPTVSWGWVWVTIAPKLFLPPPNQRSLSICLVGSQQTYFQLRAAFSSLAPSSAKGYYATGWLVAIKTTLAENIYGKCWKNYGGWVEFVWQLAREGFHPTQQIHGSRVQSE